MIKILITIGFLLTSITSFSQKKVDLKFNTNINPRIIGSIKSTFMKNYIIDTFYKLHTHSKNIIKLKV